ncbi:uncharacterized protein [Pleurodeles waltl]|uniref:uncharacterized protein isoform X3 n=1 Tax=Pleurodeles waltl TaxID=8319 RepID=UPI0037097C80
MIADAAMCRLKHRCVDGCCRWILAWKSWRCMVLGLMSFNMARGLGRMLQEDLICPSCQKPYDLPLFLPCSDSLCRTCILQEKNLASSKSNSEHSQTRKSPGESCSIYCPGCRCKVELPSPSWEKVMTYLPVNWTLKQLLEKDALSIGDCVLGIVDHNGQEGLKEDSQAHTMSASGCRRLNDTLDTSGEGEECSPLLPSAGSFGNWCWEMGVDIAEDEMEQSLMGLSFRLDSTTAHPLLTISPSGLQVTYTGEALSSCSLRRKSINETTFICSVSTALPSLKESEVVAQKLPPKPQVRADVSIKRGLFYWEVDVCNSQAYQLGVCVDTAFLSDASCDSWCLERQPPGNFRVLYGNEVEALDSVPPLVQRIGIFLNFTGGTLSFYSTITEEHLVTLPIIFPGSVRPFFVLTQGKLSISSGLPLPDFVFTTKSSAYRADRGKRCSWHRDMTFRPISPFIQRFESLTLDRRTSYDDKNIYYKSKSLCTRNLKSEYEVAKMRPK